ncbi:MAG TPA: YceI family protein [Pseudonocardiaceae bacterium]
MTQAATTRTWQDLTIPAPGTFALDTAHTRIGFVARHLMVSKVRGHFGEFSGTITVTEDPLASGVEVTIRTASIDTGVDKRDQHLRGGDFLDVESFPEMTFRSLRITDQDGADFTLLGELTIKGITREVELAVTFEGLATNPWGGEVLAFSARTEIDREEFGMTWNQTLETGGVLVGKKVTIEIEAEATRQR